MTPVELSRTVLGAVRRAVEDGELRVAVPERALVTVPGPGGCGDYATNVALQLARPAGEPPLRVAEILRTRLVGLDGITDVTVTGPGFLNISLRSSASTRLVEEILRRGPRYGHADQLTGQLYQLHCPQDVRAVVVTDVVARLLRSQGALLRSSCEGPPLPAWEAVLGVDLDLWRRSGDPPSPLDVNIRPVPAPADPVPLGRDAGRWALLHPAAHDRPRIGDEHLVQRESNPLFRVRYACARTRALGRNAADLGFSSQPGPLVSRATTVDTAGEATFDTAFESPAPSTSHATFDPPSEPTAVPAAAAVLLTALADHPRVLAQAAAHRAPDRLARHLVSVADAVLPFLPGVLPLGEEKPSAAHRARLALAEAAGTVLAGGLSLLGIDAPEHL
ncbi:ArgS-related anticodon-binding protein NrtL [Streptomyces sp. NPDC005526]|uniref:ArgS-related anticodon-binding protein NrtL n=1 Tax=Streptomyces sp. NPDC005526 TaxID=3156885 RepID=UPI0033B79FAD